MRLKIKVPASTSNIGPGFDSIGIALTLYNEFYFERSNRWEFEGFVDNYAYTDNNLVAYSMKKTYEYAYQQIPNFKISLVQCVPISRGLGSSATCVVAGVMAANYFLNNKFSQNELINIATQIEGHPDNVVPAFIGSLNSSYIVNGNVRYFKYLIPDDLIFTVAIPNFVLSTKSSRGVLPNSLSYKDIVHNLSRAINIPYALMNSDINSLFELLDDKMHEPYRFPLINESMKFKEFSMNNKIPFCISGSGSALLFISKDIIISKLKEIELENKWEFVTLNVSKTGLQIESIL